MPALALQVRPGLRIPADEIHESASRSSGPGGQHVNKTETRVTLRVERGITRPYVITLRPRK